MTTQQAPQPDLSLEFLVPTYKRIKTALEAVSSILSQIDNLPFNVSVKIRIQDDASPDMTSASFVKETSRFPGIVTATRNEKNLGMSENIYKMISTSKADFCTVLTDDDRLEPDVLIEIANDLLKIQSADHNDRPSAVFVPRYSYLEDGSLHCIECKPFNADTLILPSPPSAVKYSRNGFILTGLFLRPERVPYDLWRKNIGNAFFPVIYLGGLMLNEPVLFLDRKWFIHTVLNACHWDSWGKTKAQRDTRLLIDYLLAIQVISSLALKMTKNRAECNDINSFAISAYQQQLNVHIPTLGIRAFLKALPRWLWLDASFRRASFPYCLASMKRLIHKHFFLIKSS